MSNLRRALAAGGLGFAALGTLVIGSLALAGPTARADDTSAQPAFAAPLDMCRDAVSAGNAVLGKHGIEGSGDAGVVVERLRTISPGYNGLDRQEAQQATDAIVAAC